ncbi:MAG: hypothetical protein ACXVB1_12810, partial [Pseudobdellovibrionaceae bacterium]
MRLSNFMGIPLCLALISTGAFAGPGPSPSPTPKPSPSPTPIPPKPTPTPMPSPSPTPKKSPLTTVTENKEKGLKILADSIGKTLYVFDLDRNRKKPACTGTCAE